MDNDKYEIVDNVVMIKKYAVVMVHDIFVLVTKVALFLNHVLVVVHFGLDPVSYTHLTLPTKA